MVGGQESGQSLPLMAEHVIDWSLHKQARWVRVGAEWIQCLTNPSGIHVAPGITGRHPRELGGDYWQESPEITEQGSLWACKAEITVQRSLGRDLVSWAPSTRDYCAEISPIRHIGGVALASHITNPFSILVTSYGECVIIASSGIPDNDNTSESNWVLHAV